MNRDKIILLSIIGVFCAGIFLSPAAFADIAYFRDMADRKVTTVEDGCKAITIFLGLDKQYPDFKSQADMLKYKGIAPYNLGASPSSPLRKGLLAQMAVKALGIKGGIISRLFGMSQRYALKECVFLELMTEENARQIVEGVELIGVLYRMEKYREEFNK